MIIERKPLQSVLDLGGAIVISPDWHVNYLTPNQIAENIFDVLRNADWAVLTHEHLSGLAERFPNDTRALSEYLNDFYGLGGN